MRITDYNHSVVFTRCTYEAHSPTLLAPTIRGFDLAFTVLTAHGIVLTRKY